MKKLLFIYNPISGTGKNKKGLQEIIDYYDSENVLVTLCPAIRLKDYAKGINFQDYDYVACAGGDGTLHWTASYFLDHKLIDCLSYLPSGSTNDYAYSLGIRGDQNDYLRTTLHGTPKTIDMGRFNDSYFIYVAAFGIFTKTSYATPQKAKNVFGHMAYILEGAKEVPEMKSYNVRIECDGLKTEGDFLLGSVSNTMSIGGFRDLMPEDTQLDDGKFEAIFIRRPKNLLEMNELILSLRGDKKNENIVYAKTSDIKITSKEEIAWTLDGEFGGECTEAHISNLNKAFTIRC